MAVTCLVYPRRDLSNEECKKVGNGIYEWLYTDSGNRLVLNPGMDDLRNGELPQPYYIQRLVGIEGRGLTEEERIAVGHSVKDISREKRERLKEKCGDKAMSRHVELTIYGPAALDRNGIVAGLERKIPGELLEDILIEGVSWKETFDFDLNLYKSDALVCHILPRMDCSAAQFNRLGSALQQWWPRFRASVRHCRLFERGVTDLLSGSMPQPVRLQVEEKVQEEFSEEYGREETNKPAVFLLLRKTIFVPESLFESARRHLSVDLIEDVLVDGVSWKNGKR
jgi:hypothetical protein